MGAENSGPSPLASMAVQAGSDFLSTAFNRMFANRDYKIQRRDALNDWNMQNAYNSPQQQMQRLKEAGLNPNLVYGNGSVVANSQAMPRAANISPTRADIKVDPQSEILKYQNVQQQKVQTDNLRKQGELLEQEKALREAQRLNILRNTDWRTFTMDRQKYLDENGYLGFQLDTAKSRLANIDMQTQTGYRRMNMQESLAESNLKYTVAKVAQMNLQNTLVPYQRDIMKAQKDKLIQDLNQGRISFMQQTQLNEYIRKNEALKLIYNKNTLNDRTKQEELKTKSIDLENFIMKMKIPMDIKNDLLKVLVPWY